MQLKGEDVQSPSLEGLSWGRLNTEGSIRVARRHVANEFLNYNEERQHYRRGGGFVGRFIVAFWTLCYQGEYLLVLRANSFHISSLRGDLNRIFHDQSNLKWPILKYWD